VSDAAVAKVMGCPPAAHMWDNDLGGGLQIALFDAVGKANGVPVSALLGTKVRDWVPISWWSIDAPPEDWAAEGAEAVANGYTTMKLKPRPWFDIACIPTRQLTKIYEAFTSQPADKTARSHQISRSDQTRPDVSLRCCPFNSDG
jgi:hypothetical protein